MSVVNNSDEVPFQYHAIFMHGGYNVHVLGGST